MPSTAPSYGGLGQNLLNAAKVVTVDAFIAPVNTAYSANTGVNGGWIPLGTLQPGSYKNDFTRKFYDIMTGLPETAKASFVTGVDGKFQMNLIEPTAKAYELANGGDFGVPIFKTTPVSTTIQNTLNNPTVAPTVTTATTGGTIAAGTYILAYTYKNGAGETLISPETPVTTTGSTSTVTVNGGTLPTGVTQINVYSTAAGGASGSETLQGNYTTGSSTTLTSITAGAAKPSSNTTGPASAQDILNVASATGFTVGSMVQATTVNGTEYSTIIAVSTTGQNTVTVFPKLSAVPAAASTLKQVDGWEEPLGTSTIQYYAFRSIASCADGSQIVTWSPKIRSMGVKDEMPQGKEMFIPLDLFCYGFTDTSGNYTGSLVAKKFTLSSALALAYSS